MRKLIKFIVNNLDKKYSLIEMFFLTFFEVILIIGISSKIAFLVNSIVEKREILYEFVVFFTVTILYLVVRYIKGKIIKRMAVEFEKNLYTHMVYKITSMSLLDIYQVGKGKIASLLMNECRQIKSYVLFYLNDLIYEPFLFLGIFAYFYTFTPFFAFAMTLLIFLTIVVSYLGSRSLSKINMQRNDNVAVQLTRQNEILSNLVSLKLYQNDLYLSEMNTEASKNILISSKKYAKKKAMNYLPSLVNEYVPIAIAVVSGVVFFENGSLNFGQFVAILQLFSTVCLPMSKYASTVIETKNTIEITHRFEQILENYKVINESKRLAPFYEKNQVVFDISGLSFAYSEQLVLKDVSLRIEKNEHIGIVGKTGSGKSTLLSVLLGAFTEYFGSVKFYGNEVSMINREDIWKRIAYVDQNRYLINGTIAYNMFQDNYVAEEKQNEIIDRINFRKDIDKIDDGLNAVVTNGGTNLSGGQREKIVIGRAISKDADILIFDEPSSALDEESELGLVKAIDMFRDKTVIIVSHRKEMLAKCDRIYEVNEGTVEEVTYESIIENI